MSRFEVEERVFDKHLDQWVEERRVGSYAVILGSRLIGTRRSFDAALALGLRETGDRNFMVKQILPRGTIEWTTHLEYPVERRARRAG